LSSFRPGSEHRVNLVKKGSEAWNSEDPQWVLEHTSPEVEWVDPERDPFPGTYKGYEGVQEFYDRNTALKAAGLE
jgi:hypothetical protein